MTPERQPRRSPSQRRAVDWLSEVGSFCRCCWVSKCEENGCKLIIDLDPALVMGGTEYQEHHSHLGKLCDYLIFSEPGRPVAVAVELKSRLNASQAIEQLCRGADVVASIVPTSQQVDFRPVIVFSGRARSVDVVKVRTRKVNFRGKPRPIRLSKSGESLRAVAFAAD